MGATGKEMKNEKCRMKNGAAGGASGQEMKSEK